MSQTFGLLDCLTTRYMSVGLLGCGTIGLSDNWALLNLENAITHCRKIGLLRCEYIS